MRVLVLVKNNEVSDQDFDLTLEILESMKAMGRFNDELRAAGILIDCDGLKPSSYGKRVAFDGPFPHTREFVAGFWLWEVKDMDEALAG